LGTRLSLPRRQRETWTSGAAPRDRRPRLHPRAPRLCSRRRPPRRGSRSVGGRWRWVTWADTSKHCGSLLLSRCRLILRAPSGRAMRRIMCTPRCWWRKRGTILTFASGISSSTLRPPNGADTRYPPGSPPRAPTLLVWLPLDPATAPHQLIVFGLRSSTCMRALLVNLRWKIVRFPCAGAEVRSLRSTQSSPRQSIRLLSTHRALCTCSESRALLAALWSAHFIPFATSQPPNPHAHALRGLLGRWAR
jgi:hypothetical protein